MSDHPSVELVKKLRYDLTAMQVKVSELLRQLGELELSTPARLTCQCGSSFRSLQELQEHAYHHHDGGLPDSWAKADRLVGDAVNA